MKTTPALWTLTIAVTLLSGANAAETGTRPGHSINFNAVNRMEAPPQAAAAPQWKSRDEYDAFNAMVTATDPDKKISLAEAFLQKYPNSDFKAGAYQVEMTVYYSEGKSDKAIDAAQKVLAIDANNLDALAFLSYAFPFTYDEKAPDAAAKLSKAGSDAHHGLDVVNKLQKPDKVSDTDFKQYVSAKRALFNATIGFVALQQKNYADAITALKAADTDNPSDAFSFYRLGLAYMSSSPPDYDDGLWNLARAVDLAKAPNSTAAANAAAIQKYFDQSYISRHGSNAGEQDILDQAKTSVNPPDGFKVAVAERHKPTGNQAVDYFYSLEDTIKAGGDQAKQVWDQTKGQPFGYGGKVVSVEKGEGGETTVSIAITDDSKASDTADIVLHDKQPDAKYLEKGSLVGSFKGTIADNSLTPNFSLTLSDGEIDENSLAAAKEQSKSHGTAKPRTPASRQKPPSS